MVETKGLGPEPEADRSKTLLSTLGALGVHGRRVERPTNEKEAQVLLAAAYRDKQTVLPVGGGTALGSAALPEAVDIVLDTTAMDRILAFDSQNLTVAVLGGMTLGAINAHLAGQGRGFFLPLDPPGAERATIGGVYASNTSGPRRLLYGAVRDQALGVRGVDAQGREIGFGGKTVKNVSGYDLTKFFAGSAGSLGLVTSISFRVLPLPEAASACALAFDEIDALSGFLSALRTSVLVPSAVLVSAAEGGVGYSVLVGFEGHRDAVARQNRDLLKMATASGGSGGASDGRDELDRTLRGAVDPMAGADADYLCLRISVPISQGPTAYAALSDLTRQVSPSSWKSVLCAGTGALTLYTAPLEGESAQRLAVGAKDLARDAGGHAAPLRATRAFLAEWGARVDPALERWVIQPIKQRLDPTAVFPHLSS